jgi:hypothetical protein
LGVKVYKVHDKRQKVSVWHVLMTNQNHLNCDIILLGGRGKATKIELMYCSIDHMVEDTFINALPKLKHEICRSLFGVFNFVKN